MSRENVDLALRAFEAVNRRDLDAFLALMDDDVEVVTRIAVIEGGLHGHGGMRFWWENLLTDDRQVPVEQIEKRGSCRT
jgi:hypothetical protein